MKISNLIGLRLESCRFSKSSYSFEFDGEKGGRLYNVEVSTTCFVSFCNNSKDACADFSKHMWDILETHVVNINTDSEDSIVLEFENEKKVVIWRDESLIDDLLMIKNNTNGEWSIS